MRPRIPYHIIIASILLVVVLGGSVLAVPPRRAEAQGNTVGAIVQCLFGGIISGAINNLIGGSLNSVLPTSLQSQEVPVKELQQRAKNCSDAVMTGILKDAIKLIRDMIIRWIITGNFEGPVFSTSFQVDMAQIAQNAARTFLSSVTNMDLCNPQLVAPGTQFYSFNIALNLNCTLPPSLRQNQNQSAFLKRWIRDPGSITYEEYFGAIDPQNDPAQVLAVLVQNYNASIQRAIDAFNKEYIAGQGFFTIKDKNGNATTPGRAVAELVMQSQIESPFRQVDVADDVQTAIAAIIDTAVSKLINSGLAAVFEPDDGDASLPYQYQSPLNPPPTYQSPPPGVPPPPGYGYQTPGYAYQYQTPTPGYSYQYQTPQGGYSYQTPGGTLPPPGSGSPPNQEMQQLLDATNAYRASVGAPALQWCRTLAASAQAYTQEMASTGNYSHTGIDGSHSADRAIRAGYGVRTVGENLHQTPSSATVSIVMNGGGSVVGWLQSSEHAQNMRDPRYRHVGLARANAGSISYWAQEFGFGGNCN